MALWTPYKSKGKNYSVCLQDAADFRLTFSLHDLLSPLHSTIEASHTIYEQISIKVTEKT